VRTDDDLTFVLLCISSVALHQYPPYCVSKYSPLRYTVRTVIGHANTCTVQYYKMAPFRIPFTSRKPANSNSEVQPMTDENVKPTSAAGSPYRPSLALGVKERREEPNEFKLSCTPEVPVQGGREC